MDCKPRANNRLYRGEIGVLPERFLWEKSLCGWRWIGGADHHTPQSMTQE
jgi:hypothetical protein